MFLYRPPRLRDPIDGAYRIRRQVAVGGMSRIYAAERRRDQRPVAIKLFQVPRGQELRFRDYMLHEANALTVGAGPFVVELLDHGMSVGRPFLVLEWIPGRSLGRTIAAGAPLALDRVASIFRRVLDAIEALHARGVIHADLKPGNVMLSPHHGGERVRLVDLGAASVHGAGAARPDEVFGTPGYIAPEIAAGGSLAASSDVYSAGVLLFEMLTGTPPFSGATLADVVAQQRRPPSPRPSRLRPFAVGRLREAFDALLATALAPTPAGRFADVAAVRRAFESALRAGTASDAPGDAVPAEVSDAPTAPARPGRFAIRSRP